MDWEVFQTIIRLTLVKMEFNGLKKRGVMPYSNKGYASLDKEVKHNAN